MKCSLYLSTLIAVSIGYLSGCATVTKGGSQTVNVETIPPSGQCTLVREEDTLGIINPTPGNVTVEKGSEMIEVRCHKEGYQPITAALTPEFEGMTAGNILLGGIIGLAIDAGSGATHKYPSSITITFIPEAFASSEERDAFFDQLQTDFLANYERNREAILKQCEEERCESSLKAAETAKQAKLEEIARQRQNAIIGDVAKMPQETTPKPAAPSPTPSEPAISTAKTGTAGTTQARDHAKRSALTPISCKTRYCGNYYGYLVIKGPSRTQKLPIKITVSDGTITSAIPAEKFGTCQTSSLAGESVRVRGSGTFAGKYEAVCDNEVMGACQVITTLKGLVDDDESGDARHQNQLHLSGVSSFTCPIGNQEIRFSSKSVQAGSGTPPGVGNVLDFKEEVRATLTTSDTEPLIVPLLNAGARVIQSGH